MAVSRAMRRLRQVRELEEELSQAALESAVGELRRMEAALERARERERAGRRQVTASAGTGDLVDRIAGLEETRAGGRHAEVLPAANWGDGSGCGGAAGGVSGTADGAAAGGNADRGTEAEDAVDGGRRAQRDLDDRFLSRAQGGDKENEE